MSSRVIFIFGVLLSLCAADIQPSVIREQENTLLKALKAKDKIALLRLTDRNFHFSLSRGSAWHHITTDVDRENWIHDVTRPQVDDYNAEITNVRLVRTNQAIVRIQESYAIRLAGGNRIERHFMTEDIWITFRGTWMLTSRLSQSDPPY